MKKLQGFACLTTILLLQFQLLMAQCGCSSPTPSYPPNSVFCSSGSTQIVEVLSPATGRVWMDRNLGATRAAMSLTDSDSYGDLYQWGRRADGHQCRNSAVTSVLSTTDQPSNGGRFITNDTGTFDWRNPPNDGLWQGVNGVNDPCPTGYRLPTVSEFEAEIASWTSNNRNGAFSSPLKLPNAGLRHYSGGEFQRVGSHGYYWTSDVDTSTITSGTITFTSTSVSPLYFTRALGYSVRCIKY
jgi:uncharacterized protein (TIGR02145 family)